MQAVSRIALAAASLALSAQALAEVTLYENNDYRGRSFATERQVDNLQRSGFNDRASSIVVGGDRADRWEVCEDSRFRGRCVVLRRGEYPSLAAMGLNDRISSLRAVSGNTRVSDNRYAPPAPPPVAPNPPRRVVFYEDDGFRGRSFTADTAIADFRVGGFNDRASSAVVSGSPWEVCENVGYGGRCIVLRPGQYPSLSAMGLNDRISSVRLLGDGDRVEEGRYGPLPMVSRDYGRRDDERTYLAKVTSVRAVVEDSGQRCWVEREQVTQERSGANVPGALLGAVIGGIIGHQVGNGSGRDVATGIGVVAGAAIGGNAGRGDAQQITTTQPVQRCARAPGQARPTYWDVTYNFRGQDFRVQMTTPPGNSVTVNDQGEPRA